MDTVLVNGEARDAVSVCDRGLQYGDGVFETIAVHDGCPLLWERHIARLLKGCERLAIAAAPAVSELSAEAERLCAGVERGVLKIILTRGTSASGYAPARAGAPTRILERRPWPPRPASYAAEGVAVCLCRTRLGRNPRLAGIKHLNRLEQVLARAEWEAEFAEGLMFDDQDNLIEGTASNVFVVVQGTLLTPDLSHSGVQGVMRETVLARASELGLAWRITRLGRDALAQADEVFLTNSLIGIWPVKRVESRRYSAGGPVTARLQAALRGSHCFGDDC